MKGRHIRQGSFWELLCVGSLVDGCTVESGQQRDMSVVIARLGIWANRGGYL